MLDQQVAEKIRAKVGSLIGRRISVADLTGHILATDLVITPESINLADTTWAIAFAHGGQTTGWIVPETPLNNQAEVAPLVRSIAELVMHQSIMLEQAPHEEERLDKFIYELLYQPQYDPALLAVESKLFNIDLQQPRIAMAIRIKDPILDTAGNDSAADRELRLSRYKFGIRRALDSFYTESRQNLVAYLGENLFCILKDLQGNGELSHSLESFKRSLATIYGILKVEIKQPATIGVGNYHPGQEGLRQSFREALSAIELGLQSWDWESEHIFDIDDFGVVAPLLSGVNEQNISFSRDLLDRLGESSEVLTTLNTFFANNMSLTRTANLLKIHRNTLVYRLDRITDLLKLDPRNFNDAAQIKLAILYSKFIGINYEA